jgi:ribonuclease Z
MPREFVILGTASQAPTKARNHNGYLLRWDRLGILFDPGEGTQRQMLLAGVRSSSISHIAITHRHGDHTLGLPGVLQLMALQARSTPISVIHPVEAGPYLDRLLAVDLFDGGVDVRRVPLPTDRRTVLDLDDVTTLVAEPLSHRVPTLGYRVQEADGRTFDPQLLAQHGVEGPAVGALQREGSIQVGGRVVAVEEVSDHRSGQAAGFVMDTRECPAIGRLLDRCDLAVVEATYQRGDEALAQQYGHLTAEQAGRAAMGAGVRRLVLSHYSERYDDPESFAVQAREHHDDVVAAVDLMTVPAPGRG